MSLGFNGQLINVVLGASKRYDEREEREREREMRERGYVLIRFIKISSPRAFIHARTSSFL